MYSIGTGRVLNTAELHIKYSETSIAINTDTFAFQLRLQFQARTHPISRHRLLMPPNSNNHPSSSLLQRSNESRIVTKTVPGCQLGQFALVRTWIGQSCAIFSRFISRAILVPARIPRDRTPLSPGKLRQLSAQGTVGCRCVHEAGMPHITVLQ
jgi:hypothetical protein